MNNVKILCFGKADVSEGIEVNKIGTSRKCDLYFLNKGFKFQPNFCNWRPNLLMSMNIQNSDYWCIITEITKSAVIKLLKIVHLTEKSTSLNQKQSWCCKFT